MGCVLSYDVSCGLVDDVWAKLVQLAYSVDDAIKHPKITSIW